MKNIKTIKKTKIEIFKFILITLTLILTSCYPVLQSAELAPRKKSIQTIRTGGFVSDFFITECKNNS